MAASWGDGQAYESYMGRWSRLLAPHFLRWANPPRHGEVVDVGCGTGVLCEALATYGAKRIVGVDKAEGYLDHASTFLGRRLPNVTFEVGDAMQLPVPSESFDAAVSGLVLNFVPDASVAIREMKRVVRPGGVVAVYVWDYAGGMEFLRRFWDAAVEVNPGAAELDEGSRFAICKPDALSKVFRDALLAEVECTNLDVSIAFRDFEDYWKPFLGGQGAGGAYVGSLNEEGRARLRERLRKSLPMNPAGSISMTLRAWAARGTKAP